jgi:indolepyruvate decarboxylase
MLGAFMTDINLGIYTADLDPALTINATSERISVKYHHYEDITFKDFLEGLTKTSLGAKHKLANLPKAKPKPFRAKHGQKVTVKRFFQRMNEYLEGNSVVICDIGDSLFGAADLTIHRRTEFLSPAYYTSMGFAVPAALGAQIGNRKLRPIVFVGDGAFQMTGQELSPIARYGLNPIVFVLNNKGYTTERFINEGPYNDIHDWAFHLWPEMLRTGWGCEVRTEGELEEALEKAKANKKSFSIINLHLDPLDKSEALDRLGKRLSKRVS